MVGPATFSALGGGQGHRMRALALARRWDGSVRVLHGSSWSFPIEGVEQHTVSPDVARLRLLEGGETLVVDTFPGGVAGEVVAAVLAGFDRTILIQRALQVQRYPDYEQRAALYDERWLPYDQDRCEWGGRSGVYIGPLHRMLPMASGQACSLVVLGPSDLLPPGWLARLPTDTCFINRPIAELPAAQRILSVGAGYHMVHELLPYHAAHLPLSRRYDDQYRRAGLHGRALTSRRELEQFLGGGCSV